MEKEVKANSDYHEGITKLIVALDKARLESLKAKMFYETTLYRSK